MFILSSNSEASELVASFIKWPKETNMHPHRPNMCLWYIAPWAKKTITF